jgi:hypothetical protein
MNDSTANGYPLSCLIMSGQAVEPITPRQLLMIDADTAGQQQGDD